MVDATVDMGVAWPVVQDNDFVVWGSYDNRFWPAKYLIDQHGEIRYRHFGEGKYAETEEQIRALLAETGAGDRCSGYAPARGPAPRLRIPRQRRPPDARTVRRLGLRQQPLPGRARPLRRPARYLYGGRPGSPTAQATSRAPSPNSFSPPSLLPDMIYFHGPWSIGPESAVHARETQEYT